MKVDVVVIGSGPAGYSAAFKAAQLGLDVTVVDPRPKPGGSYLYETCIPCKTYLAQTKLLWETQNAGITGIDFQKPDINIARMNSWKNDIQNNLSDQLLNLCTTHGVQLIQGTATFESSNAMRLKDSELSKLHYKYAVIAAGAASVSFPGTSFDVSNKIWSPAKALNIEKVPQKILVVGGGCTGIEIASIYATLGSKVDLAEQNNQILDNADKELTHPVSQQLSSQLQNLLLHTTVTKITEGHEDVKVEMQNTAGQVVQSYDYVVIAIGYKAHANELGLENTSVQQDDFGRIETDRQQRTAEPNIFAVGDITSSTMQAHRAIRQGQIAAEVIAGQSSFFDVRAIPIIVNTYPTIAWCGLTERDALSIGIPVTIKKYPWKYSTRAITLGLPCGLTKIIISKDDNRILGAGITGTGAEDLISEWVLAIEMGALLEDIELCLHGYPTLSSVISE